MATETTGENIQKLAKLIHGIRVAMLTTVAGDGSLRSRPMATQDTDFDGTLWFFTLADAPKVGEVERREQVNVSYADPDTQRYVSVSGTAHLVRDRRQLEALWKPILKAWFPKGLDDPEIALLRVDVERAEYWDAPSGKLVQLVGLVKALVTGERYVPGDNEKIEIGSAR